MSLRGKSDSPMSPEARESGKFWRLPGLYFERLPADGGLCIWLHGEQVVLGARSADSLLEWMDRSR